MENTNNPIAISKNQLKESLRKSNSQILNCQNPTQYGVCWSTEATPTTDDSKTEEGPASDTGAFTSDITSLSPNTTYYVRAYATNSASTVYGAQVSFTTAPLAATVTTQDASDITTTTATGNGTITILGAPNPSAYGVCWNTTGMPTTDDSKTDEGVASSATAFTSNISELSPNTTYYVRAYATNTAGTTYGDPVEFTTQMTTSISNNKKQGHFAYPNPTKGMVYISGAFENESFEVYNLSGNLVKKGTANNSQVDISDLSNGAYYIIINNSKFKITKY